MKKGFTLIELLAVIAIISILTIVIVPKVIQVTKNIKKETFKVTAQNIIKASDIFYSKQIIKGTMQEKEFIFSDTLKAETTDGVKLNVSGKLPTTGFLRLKIDGTSEMNVCNAEYCACKGYGTNVISITESEGCQLEEDGTVSNSPITNEQIDELWEEINGLKAELLNELYPIGSIYITTSVTTEVQLKNIFGQDTEWVSFGTGKTLVGIDTNQIEFNTVEKTGGEKTHFLSISEMPSHTHIQNAHTHTQNAHGHNLVIFSGGSAANPGTALSGFSNLFLTNNPSQAMQTGGDGTLQSTTATNQNTTATNQNNGGGGAHNNLQPYITVYMWKRIN